VKLCKRKLELLIGYNVTPILIFDGARLVMKQQTEEERERNRAEYKRKAEEYLQQGNGMMAHKMFSAAVDITPEMAYQFAQSAKQLGVEYYVAPYEADA
jgi:exonuclease 1